MNSFEMDLKRAFLSRGFFIGLVLEVVILLTAGFDSDLFRMGVPVICTFPYTTAWLADYQSGFLKAYLPRCSVPAYILGKILACGISGGALEALGGWLYLCVKSKEEMQVSPMLLFMSGMFWAVLAAAIAALSQSRYLAYGGAFVIYYLLVILYERYFKSLYCLYPYEWIAPEHTWVFGKWGIVLLIAALTAVFICLYDMILRRCISNV